MYVFLICDPPPPFFIVYTSRFVLKDARCHIIVNHFNPLYRSNEVMLVEGKDRWVGIMLMATDTVLDQLIASSLARSLITRRTRFAKSVLRSARFRKQSYSMYILFKYQLNHSSSGWIRREYRVYYEVIQFLYRMIISDLRHWNNSLFSFAALISVQSRISSALASSNLVFL